MPFEFLRYTTIDKIGRVTLARPPVNAVNQQMYGEIRTLFGNIDEYLPDIRALVLDADGEHFCAGNDLGEFQTLEPINSPGRMRSVREAFYAIQDCPVPVIAVVHGMVAGTGVAIAASCDLLVAGESARFATPEVGVGVMGGARHLARLVPEPVMRLMYFTADPVPAVDLVRYGTVSAVVPDDQREDTALRLAGRIARHSRAALRMAKESLDTTEWMPLKQAYEFEQGMTARLCGHPDSLEARAAVVERRTPWFSDSSRAQVDEPMCVPDSERT